MFEIELRIPSSASRELVALYISEKNQPDDKVQLRIILDESNISLRDFAAYLNFWNYAA